MKKGSLLNKAVFSLAAICIIAVVFPVFNLNEKYNYPEGKRLAPGKIIKLLGKEVHYVEYGEGEPVIFIHGFLYNTVMWQGQFASFAEKYKVYAIDLFGFGYSERRAVDEYSFKMFSDQIIHFMDAMTMPRAILVGQSMGAGTSVYLAASQPDRVKALVLVAPAVLPYESSLASKIYELPLLGEFLNSIPGGGLIRSNIENIWFYDKSKVTDDYFRKILEPLQIKGSSDSLLYILRNVLKPPFLQKEAEKVKIYRKPTLIVHGADDPAVPVEKAHELAKLWPWAKLLVYEKARHSPHEEYPVRFNQQALDFLSKVGN